MNPPVGLRFRRVTSSHSISHIGALTSASLGCSAHASPAIASARGLSIATSAPDASASTSTCSATADTCVALPSVRAPSSSCSAIGSAVSNTRALRRKTSPSPADVSSSPAEVASYAEVSSASVQSCAG